MWKLAGKELNSRFLIGTASYPSLEMMCDAIGAAKAEVITLSIKRAASVCPGNDYFWIRIKQLSCHLLPNTAGCKDAKSAIQTALLSRELFATHWIKLEVIGDDYNLIPDSVELLLAAKALIAEGFEVFPYCTDDLVTAQKLADLGCNIVMPWASPIGSGKGVINPYALETLRHRLPKTTLIVDAGIGRPSHATQVMELGFDGVLLNTAVAHANCPVTMAMAFHHAIIAGREAYEAGIMPEKNRAQASTPLLETPFWQQQDKSYEGS